MTKILTYWTGISLLLATAGCADSTGGEDSTQVEPQADTTMREDTIPEVPVVRKDSIHDQLALYIAGKMQVEGNSPFQVLQEKDYWQEFSRTFDSNWSNFKTRQLDKMIQWRKEVFSTSVDGSRSLYYPFSGPDFLHAQVFYPNAPSITMFALERIVDLPNFLEMDEETSEKALNGIQHALRDIYSKSYFITTHMGADLNFKEANGVLPMLYVFMARTNQEILQVDRVTLDDRGKIIITDSLPALNRVKGVRIKFRERGKKDELRKLVYFNMDIENTNLEKHPEFVSYLRSLAPVNTFVKSASYVMHWGSFTQIRDIAVEISASIFQDDTGVRINYLPQDEWDVQLFGQYTRPIKDFPSSTYQADLKKMYDTTDKEKIMQLPFSLGYHIVADKVQNHIIAKKKGSL